MSRLIAAALLLGLSGCVPKVTARIYGDAYPARPESAEVQLYSVDLPECPFDEIALVSVLPKYQVAGRPRDQVFRALREKVRELGGDAVVGMTVLQAPPDNGLVDGVQGTVVRFKDREGCEMPMRSAGTAP